MRSRRSETYLAEVTDAVSCGVTLLTAQDDPLVHIDEARAWANHTRGRFRLESFPTGGHFFPASHRARVFECIHDAFG
jgi:surfactin synthase thioesterase subunit